MRYCFLFKVFKESTIYCIILGKSSIRLTNKLESTKLIISFPLFFIDFIDENPLISLCKCLWKMFESGLNQGFFSYFCLSPYISV